MSHKRRYDSLPARNLRVIHTWADYAHSCWTLQNDWDTTRKILEQILVATEDTLEWFKAHDLTKEKT